MSFNWFPDNTVSFWVQGILLLVFSGLLAFTYFKVSRRKIPSIMFILMVTCSLFSFVFQLIYLFGFSVMMIFLSTFFTFMSNIGDVRKFFANPFRRTGAKKDKSVAKITDKKSLFAEVQKTVINLSDKKIGALITFEKNTNLTDICKNGISVDAPFSNELIQTIFFPGTRLHDGAVIVRDGVIKTASVFYTPTTKPFAVKYGSRHRAALGISEISDAVTVVVSEETGLVSIAYDGVLERIEADKLANALNNYF